MNPAFRIAIAFLLAASFALAQRSPAVQAGDDPARAPAAKAGAAGSPTDPRAFWSFQPIRRSTPPPIARAEWARNAVDRFVLARLEVAGIPPAPEANRVVLIRRVYLDLTGLPPEPGDVDAFLGDNSPDAWERLIDRLLASPHHGERWAQHWLDVVRFAESEGFEYDRPIPDAWRYRDWVIGAINSDLPFDRFIVEQLAGDELDAENLSTLAAAGFHRLGPVRRNAGNQEVAGSRNEVLTERTDIVGAAFLGLTMGCARCHDHKFDPIPQEDYYRLQAFFAASEERDVLLASAEQETSWKAAKVAAEKEVAAVQKKLQGAAAEERTKLEVELAQAEARLPGPLPSVATVKNAHEGATPIHVLQRGEWEKKGKSVTPGLPRVLAGEGPGGESIEPERPRTALARWVAEPSNPLTARVIANRIWQHHFGLGLVRTPNDFGANGDRPSHPELLDYLAAELIASGWSLKSLHRQILLSSTYRQSSDVPPAAHELDSDRDPDHRLFGSFHRRRLEAEEIRDGMLAASETLNLSMGGPSVVLPVEPELVSLLYSPLQWQVTPDPAERHRRSVYLMAKRNLHLPFLEAFDHPALQTSAPRRESSTHVPQALELLNGTTSNDLAEALAAQLSREAGSSTEAQVELAFRRVAGRPPSDAERDAALAFLRESPLRELAIALFNSNAFLYVD